jgi:hypothetical protein
VPVYHPLRRSALYLLRTLSQSTGKLPNQNVIEEDLGYDKKPPVATKNAYVYKGWYINEAVAVKKLPDLGDMKLRKASLTHVVSCHALQMHDLMSIRPGLLSGVHNMGSTEARTHSSSKRRSDREERASSRLPMGAVRRPSSVHEEPRSLRPQESSP